MNYIFHRIILLILISMLSACAIQQSVIYTPSKPPTPKIVQGPNVALVLGGGGSKGVAHVGVLEVLEKNGIPIDLIVGTSSGSGIGALYADEPNYIALKRKVLAASTEQLLDFSVAGSLSSLNSLTGPYQGIGVEKFLLNNLNVINIESLKIPFVAVTTDIINNKLFNISSGPIAPAVRASSAIPPFFTPVKIYGKTLIDGGVIAPVPVEVAKLYNPKLIIAVNITAPPPKSEVTNMLYLTYRSIEIFYYELAKSQAYQADINIHPDLNGFGIFEDGKGEILYQAGRNAALKEIQQIKSKLQALNIPLKH